MKVYREETPRKGKTPRGVRNLVTLQRTNRQPSFSQLRSRCVTACCGNQARSSSLRALRMARAAGDPTWRHSSKLVIAATPRASH